MNAHCSGTTPIAWWHPTDQTWQLPTRYSGTLRAGGQQNIQFVWDVLREQSIRWLTPC